MVNMKQLIESLKYGTLSNEYNLEINNIVIELMNKEYLNSDELDLIGDILLYSNIIWENFDTSMTPLEDGVYDILREVYKNNGRIPPVGGISVETKLTKQITDNEIIDYIIPAKLVNDIKENEDLLYKDTIIHYPQYNKDDGLITPALFSDNISKRKRDTAHEYPNLVGTLEKCKFVMKYQAEQKGVLNDSNVRVLERDFFGEHVKRGILDPNRIFSILMMLKFDGVSVEGDVVNRVFTSRGDAIGGVASDLTPIMRNYRFPHAPYIQDKNEAFGVQFEAIMTYNNLYRYNQARGYNYKNCRTAISGLFSSSDAWKYMDYVTLVPLASSLNLPKDIELEFLNKYYSKGVHNTYTVISGNLTTILFQIKRFVEEAEMLRDYVGFQYDGIVIQYMDEDIISKLGRVNAVNMYAQAVKFNPLKKQTIFTGYTFTVGQDGYITPMIHFNPVEFMGTIHPKSSGHSFDRFMELGLRLGDMIDVEYVNDVMPYVTKPDNSFNDENEKLNELFPFPTHCPVCGTEIKISDSMKSAYCPNINCEGRRLARVVNMLSKLGFEQFAEANVEKIGFYTFHELMCIETSIVKEALNSEIMANKFDIQRQNLINSNKWDYEILGSIGFDSLAEETWKLVLRNIPLEDIVTSKDDILYQRLVNIKGIGSVKAKTIIERREFFIDDIVFIINNMPNIRRSFGYECTGKKIRFTGFRDKELVEYLTELGHDISDKSVTRDTNLLIVVDEQSINTNPSSKVKNAIKYNIPIVTLQDFKQNMNVYLE